MAAKFLTPNFSEYLNTKLNWKCLGCNSAEVIYSHVHVPRFYLQHCKETKNTHTKKKKPKKQTTTSKLKWLSLSWHQDSKPQISMACIIYSS